MIRTFRFHLGSLAYGAFLVAVVQFLRLAAEYIDYKTKDLQANNKSVHGRAGCGGVRRGREARGMTLPRPARSARNR